MSDQPKPTSVKSWHAEEGKGLFVNGELLPYWVSIEGPMVEQMPGWEDRMHILWLPLIAEGPAPRAGRPDAEPVDPPTKETR